MGIKQDHTQSSLQSTINLAAEINKLISQWKPGELFRVFHYVLAIPEAMKQDFTMYQSKIRSGKLFLETKGF